MHLKGRPNNRPHPVGAKDIGKDATVIFATLTHRLAESMMADINRRIFEKSASPEDVIRMDVAHHNVFNGSLRLLPDRRAEILAVGEAAAGVGDEHAGGADNKTYIGDGVVISRCRVFVDAAADVNASADFIGRERSVSGERRRSTPARSKDTRRQA